MSCYWSHKWSRWTVIADEKMAKGDEVIGQMLTQQRECTDCGRIQRRVVRTTVLS